MLLKWKMSIVWRESLDFTTTKWSSKTETKCEVGRAQFWRPHPPFSAPFTSPLPVFLIRPDPWWISLLSTLFFLQSKPIFQKVAVNFHFISLQADGTFVNFPQWHWLLFPLLHPAKSWSVDRSEPATNRRCFQEICECKHMCAHHIHVNTQTHFQVTFTQPIYFWLNYTYK